MSARISVFKSRLKRPNSTAGHATDQAVSSKPSDRRLRKSGCQKSATKTRNKIIQFATAGRTQMLAAGNFGDWNAAVDEVPWSSEPKTPMNNHGKLMLHLVWDCHPVKVITQQP